MKASYFDRLTVPKLAPLHEVRPATAVNLLDVTATLISVKPRAADPPGPAQGGGGSTYSMMPYPVGANRPAVAGPEKLSPFLNVADHVPVSEFGACSLSANCIVPSPEMASLIEPDQLPAGDTPADGVVGEVGTAPPLQPATLSISATTGASRRFITPPPAS
jgi:hypothetical protein